MYQAVLHAMITRTLFLLFFTTAFFTSGAQAPVGKTYIAETSVFCEKTTGGGCMVYSYCAMYFTSDHVEVWSYDIDRCSPPNKGKIPESKKKKYTWSFKENRIYSPGFGAKGLYLNGDQLLGSMEEYQQKSLHFWEQPQPAGKKYILQAGSTCKGKCSLETYRFGFFRKDSVDIWTCTETDCMPRPGKRKYGRKSETKTYAWTIQNNQVIINGVDGEQLVYSTSRLAEMLNYTAQTEKSRYLVRYAAPGASNIMSKRLGGYVNQDGDTVVPIGKYTFCYNDTIRDFGIVCDSAGQFLAIDRWGYALYKVYPINNYTPDPLSEGLFRIYEGEALPPFVKTGYANSKGDILIKPRYVYADPFKNGKARVTYEFEQESGDYITFRGKNWFYIDQNGDEIK